MRTARPKNGSRIGILRKRQQGDCNTPERNAHRGWRQDIRGARNARAARMPAIPETLSNAMRFLPALVLVLPAFAACQNTGEAVSRAQFQRQEQFTRRFTEAFRSGDADQIAALYAVDAILMPPNMPAVEGRSAIRDYFAAMPEIREPVLRTVEMDNLDNKVLVRGEYTMTMILDGEAVEDRGKYLEVRAKSPDGVWRITRDMYSSDLPPSGHH